MTTRNDHRLRDRISRPPLHTCPACSAGFDWPDARLEPETVPWWRPQRLVHVCPTCRVQLHWVPDAQEALTRRWMKWVNLPMTVVGGGLLYLVMNSNAGGRGWPSWLVFIGLMVMATWVGDLHGRTAPLMHVFMRERIARDLALGHFELVARDPPSRLPQSRSEWCIAALSVGGTLAFALLLLGRSTAWGGVLTVAAIALLGAFSALVMAMRSRKRALAASAWPLQRLMKR